MENIAKTTHPLILIAAVSVTVASLAAAAHFTGLIPTRGNEAPTPPVAVVDQNPASLQSMPSPAPAAKADNPPAVSEANRPAPPPRAHRSTRETTIRTAPRHESDPVRSVHRGDDGWRQQGGTQRVSDNNTGIDVIPSSSAHEPAAAPTPPVCRDCGTVEGVREVAAQGEGTGLGAIAGGVLGGILGHQVGRGTGKDLANIAGAVGGAVAGHQVEKNVRTEKQFQVTVRFDDGSVRSYTLPGASWRTGDRVRVSNGTLVAMADQQR